MRPSQISWKIRLFRLHRLSDQRMTTSFISSSECLAGESSSSYFSVPLRVAPLSVIAAEMKKGCDGGSALLITARCVYATPREAAPPREAFVPTQQVNKGQRV